MDYLSNIKNSYDISFDNVEQTDGAFLLYSDGSQSDYIEYEPTHEYSYYDEVIYYFVNYGNRFFNKTPVMIFYYDVSEGHYFIFTKEGVDYYIVESIQSQGNYYLDCLPNNEEHQVLEDLNLVLGYSRYSSGMGVTNFTYGSYNVYFENDESFFMDLYNIKSFVNGSTTYPKGNENYMAVRGENAMYSKYFADFDLEYANTLRISYGDYYSNLYNQGYANGNSNGFQAGWVQGNQNGYNVGLNSGGGLTTTQANAFTYIGAAFGAAANILSIEILPNVTIGLAFSIPMTIILITTIFKLVRK